MIFMVAIDALSVDFVLMLLVGNLLLQLSYMSVPKEGMILPF